MTEPTDPHLHWSDPEKVAQFASRDPDVRLTKLLERYPDPGRVRVLDLGAAGGRNTELLARLGFDVVALDVAPAMVEAVRSRLAPILGEAEARRRVTRGEMRDLSRYEDGAFALVVALGVLHQALSEAEWREALREAARVLAPGGLLLVSNFAPGTGPIGAPLAPLTGDPFVFEGFRPGGRMVLRAPGDLDADLLRVGFVPETPTQVVEREVNDRRRVTVNALYRKPV